MKKDLKRSDLEQFEQVDVLEEDIPLLDEVYVISKSSKHESGYNYIETYGVAYNEHGDITWAKKIGNYSDVIHIKAKEEIKHSDYTYLFSVDFQEVNVARYFARFNFKFEITGAFSDFEILIVES